MRHLNEISTCRLFPIILSSLTSVETFKLYFMFVVKDAAR